MIETKSSQYIIGLMKENYVPEYGVVNLRAVIDEMVLTGRDLARDAKELYKDKSCEACGYHSHAAGVLRELAATERFSGRDARFLLKMTDDLGQLDLDEYYGTIAALSRNPQLASLLVDFADRKLQRHDVWDWRWLAFYAIGSVMPFIERGDVKVSSDFVQRLAREAGRERNLNRKSQMGEIVGQIRSVQAEDAV